MFKIQFFNQEALLKACLYSSSFMELANDIIGGGGGNCISPGIGDFGSLLGIPVLYTKGW